MSEGDLLRRAAGGEALDEGERAALARWMLRDRSQAGFGVTAADAAQAVGARLRWLAPVCRALAAGPLDVAGYAERVEPGVEEVFLFLLPLARELVERVGGCGGRLVVAIAGLPAGGKSVFAALMARVIGARRPPFGVATVGLDGYHYPNAYLLAHRTPPAVSEAGALKLYKGAHFTFDAARLVADLRRIRSAEATLRLPGYDRRLHEPVEGRIAVAPGDRLVLVEGNYLLCRESGWEAVPDLFDLRMFLALPPGANREPMIARHMRGGRRRDDAERHFERCDRPNTDLVAATGAEADIVVELSRSYAIEAVTRLA